MTKATPKKTVKSAHAIAMETARETEEQKVKAMVPTPPKKAVVEKVPKQQPKPPEETLSPTDIPTEKASEKANKVAPAAVPGRTIVAGQVLRQYGHKKVTPEMIAILDSLMDKPNPRESKYALAVGAES